MNILLLYKNKRTFVERDREILQEDHHVTAVKFSIKKLPQIYRLMRKNDLIVCWFASTHTYFASKITNKPMVVIVGGYDASDIPGYGLFASRLRRHMVSSIYKKADAICPVDSSLADCILRYLPQVKEKITVIPTGYDAEYFTPEGEKNKNVLSVCYLDKTNLWRKGIATLIEVSRRMPDVTFYVVGKINHEIFTYPIMAPPLLNVKMTGFLSDEELLHMYQQAKVFCLLSKYEGLPNVLCEAMLCNCIPVTTGVCGIPHAQGDLGYYVEYGDVEGTKEAIEKALAEKTTGEGRERIKTLFTIPKRKKLLNQVIDSVVGD